MSKQIENAVRAFQLYHGSGGCRMHDQQKLYTRAVKACERIAKSKGMHPNDVQFQVGKEAQRRGAILPIPGKDI